MKRIALLFATLAIGGLAFVWFVASRLSAPVQASVGAPPADLDAGTVHFASESGATIHGWLSVAPEGKGVVLLLPGVRANRLSMVERARFLHQAGYSVLLIDLQATGESKGERITFGWLESRDVLAAVAFVREEFPGRPIAVIGTSLGGAAALLATPPLRVDALVLEAVYPTVERATSNRLGMRFGPIGRLGTPLLLIQLRPRIGISPAELRPVEHIGAVPSPILVIGGSDDRHTTPADTLLLYANARDPKELWMIPGAGHVDFHAAHRAEYERRVLQFLDRNARPLNSR